MAIERPNAEYEKDLIVQPINKKEIEGISKEQAKDVVDDTNKYFFTLQLRFHKGDSYFNEVVVKYLSPKKPFIDTLNTIAQNFGATTRINNSDEFNEWFKTITISNAIYIALFVATAWDTFSFVGATYRSYGQDDAEPVVNNILCDGILGKGIVVTQNANFFLDSLLTSIAANVTKLSAQILIDGQLLK